MADIMKCLKVFLLSLIADSFCILVLVQCVRRCVLVFWSFVSWLQREGPQARITHTPTRTLSVKRDDNHTFCIFALGYEGQQIPESLWSERRLE